MSEQLLNNINILIILISPFIIIIIACISFDLLFHDYSFKCKICRYRKFCFSYIEKLKEGLNNESKRDE